MNTKITVQNANQKIKETSELAETLLNAYKSYASLSETECYAVNSVLDSIGISAAHIYQAGVRLNADAAKLKQRLDNAEVYIDI